MPITINGNGSITGISAGGLPDASITVDDIANGAITPAKLSTGAPTWDTSSRFLVGTTTGSGNGSLFALMPDNTNGTGIVVRARNTGATASQPAVVFEKPDTTVNSAIISDIGTNYLAFNHNGAERMRITSHGEIRITQSSTGLTCINSGANGTAIIYFQTPSAELGKIRINGAGVAYDTTSDYRLKENIEPITDAVSRLQALKPWRFNFISHPDVTVDGFLAHEAQEVVPEAVGGHKDEEDAEGNPIYQGIDQSKLVPLLTAALQELVAEVESLKAKVAALEAQ